jgi:hypothetical protein
MSAGADSVEHVIERWGRERVLALAPDASSRPAAAEVAGPAKWRSTGCDGCAVWGEFQGGGRSSYRVSVDLSEPAFRCPCPSRKAPCKHALGLLLLWSDGDVAEDAPPAPVAEWLARHRDRTVRAPDGRAAGGEAPVRSPKTAEQRERRVAAGLEELDRWLRDQVAQGLAHADRAPGTVWDDVARRLVDAQAGALASQVRELGSLPADGRLERLLEEYSLLRLLVTAFRRRDELPEPLRATVRSRVGFTVSQEEVLAGAKVRDRWYVAGCRDVEQDRLIARRVWLRGQDTGRSALVLSFAAPGRALDASLAVGDTVDAELAFYPGALPLRALVAARHAAPVRRPPRGTTVAGLLREHADALARDPWLERWPAVLAGVGRRGPPLSRRRGRCRAPAAQGGRLAAVLRLRRSAVHRVR